MPYTVPARSKIAKSIKNTRNAQNAATAEQAIIGIKYFFIYISAFNILLLVEHLFLLFSNHFVKLSIRSVKSIQPAEPGSAKATTTICICFLSWLQPNSGLPPRIGSTMPSSTPQSRANYL